MMKTLATLGILAITLTGCAGGSSDDDAAAKAIADSIAKDQGSGMVAMDRKDADCIGEGLVDKIGTDRLKKYGLLTEDGKVDKGVTDAEMSAEDAEAATDTLFDCTEVTEMIKKGLPTDGMDEKTRKCIEGALTEDALHGMFVKMFSGREAEAQKELTEPLMGCVSGGVPQP